MELFWENDVGSVGARSVDDASTDDSCASSDDAVECALDGSELELGLDPSEVGDSVEGDEPVSSPQADVSAVSAIVAAAELSLTFINAFPRIVQAKTYSSGFGVSTMKLNPTPVSAGA